MAERILAYKIIVTGTEAQLKELGRHDIAIKKLAGDTRLLEKRALELANQNKQGGIEFKGLTKKIGENRAKIIDLRNAKNSLAKTISNESKLNRTNANTIGQVNAQLAIEKKRINDVVVGSKRFKVIADRIRNLERRQREFNTQLGRGRTFANQFGKGAANAFTKVGLAIGGAIVAFRSLQRIIGGTISTVADFEKTFTNVITLLNTEDAKRFREPLEKGAIQIIKDYGLAIEDVNKALFDAISAGIPAADAIEFLNEAAKLSIGGVTDLKTAVDGMTTVMNAFNVSQENAEQVSAAFFSAQKFGKTTVNELSESIGQIAPIASQANLSFQEVLSTLALLTKQGLKTDLATTALRSTITALIKPSKEAAREFERLGIPFGASGLKGAGLANVLVKIAEAAEEDADVLAKLIPNIRALTGVGALGTEQLKEYDEILRVVNEDFGEGSSLSQAFALQQETLTDKSKRFIGVLKALILQFADGLKPALKGVVDIGIDTIEFIIKNEQTIKGLLKILASLVGIYIAWKGTLIASNIATKALNASQVLLAATSNKLGALQRLATIQTAGLTIAQKAQRISAIAGAAAMRILNAVMKANPIGLVVIALTALIGGLKLLEKTSERNIVLTKRTGELNELLKKALNDTDEARGKNNKQIEIFNELSKLEQDTLIQTIKNQKLKAIADLQAAERRRKDIAEQAIQLTLLQKIEVGLFSFGNTARVASLITSKAIKNQTEATEEFNESINQLKQDIIDLDKTQSDLTEKQTQAELERIEQAKLLAKERTKVLTEEEKKRLDELKKLQDKDAEERRKRVEENNKIILDLERQLLDDKLKLIEEDFEKTKELADRKVQAEVDLTRAKLETRLLEAETLEEEREIELELEDIRFQEELDRLRLRQEATKEEIKVNQQEIELLTKIHEDNKTKIEQNATQKRLKIAQDVGKIIGSLVNGLANIFEAAKQRELSAAGDNADKRAEIEKKFAKKQKLISLAQAVIKTALAVAAGLSSPAVPPFPSAIAAGIAGAIQIGIIAATKFAKGGILQKGGKVPIVKLKDIKFTDLAFPAIGVKKLDENQKEIKKLVDFGNASGNALIEQSLPKGGILKGKSHEEGGIAFTVDGQSGFEAEGGEILVNKNIHSRPDFVDAISRMNHITGGKRFQAGAILPIPNITRIQQQAVFQDVFTREEAVELIQETLTTITVQQVESEVTETQKTVQTIESGVEF